MTEVDRLTGAEGGLWRIWAQGSSHILDLDQMTVTRVPGAGRPRSINDATRPLCTIGACRVGERGAWTMHTDGRSDTIDFYWHYTSEIRSIERLTGAEQSDAERLIDTTERLQPLAHISVLFDPPSPGFNPRSTPQFDGDYEMRDTVRSALAALLFDGASEVQIIADDGRLTVTRVSAPSLSVLVRAWFPADGRPAEEFRLCHGTRRGAGPFAPGGTEFYNSELSQLGEPVLDLAVAALTARDIDELPLPQPLRWRYAGGRLLSRLHPSDPVHDEGRA